MGVYPSVDISPYIEQRPIIYNIITHNGIYFIYLSNLKSGDEKTRVLKVKRPGVKHPGGVKSKHLIKGLFNKIVQFSLIRAE
jgi:hypothetical protein